MAQNKYKTTATAINKAEWAKDLDEFKHSLLITPEWVESMSNEKATPLYLNFVQEEKIVGKISGLVCDKGKFNGKQLFFYSSLALHTHTQELFDACHTALYAYSKNNGYSRIILGSYDQQHSLKTAANHFFVTERFEYVVDLTPEKLVFDSRFRYNVRRAKKNEIFFEQNNSPEVLNRLFELLQITRKHRIEKYGTDYNPFFLWEMNAESLTRLMKTGIVKLYSVKKDEKVDMVCFTIEKGKQINALLAASTEEAYELRFPNFIFHEMITQSKERGFHYFNPGGGSSDAGNAGLEQFKHSMGAEKITIYGATTNFINFPQNLLNPLMNIGRRIPRENPVVKFMKKII